MVLGYLIILNNYLHDVATAMVISLTLLMTYIGRQVDAGSPPEQKEFFLRIYRYFSRLALFSLVWILVGGIPRALAFNSYELLPAAQKGIVPVLIFKHIILFGLVFAGILLWRRINHKVKRITVN